MARGDDDTALRPSSNVKKDASSKAAPKKSLRPLSSFLGSQSFTAISSSSGTGKSSSSSSSKSHQETKKQSEVPAGNTSRSPATKKQRRSPTAPSTSKALSQIDTIELSSDDDALEILDDEDGDITLTGFSAGPSGSTAQSSTLEAPRTSKRPIDISPKSKQAEARAIPLSEKSKGKQKAHTDFVQLEVSDAREDALWAEKYAPMGFESLCVHKKKVQDVQKWLEEAFSGGVTSKYRRVMVLSGPAGSAKTATLRVLSHEMDFEVVEYRTTEGNSESFSNQFPAFLSKATVATSLSFGTLTMDNKIAVAPPPRKPASSQASTIESYTKSKNGSKPTSHRKIILVEDLPNIFTSQLTKSTFRSALISFVTSKRMTNLGPNANIPLVLIVSEALYKPGSNEGENAALRYQGSGQENISVRSVVPIDVLRAPNCAEFKFNAIAPTLMKKALNAILDREYADKPNRRPTARALQLVIEASDGDIRSALNTLQFVVGDTSQSSSQVTEVKKGKKRKNSGKVKETEEDEGANKALMHLVATKEPSLFLFHALGKVLYNKRWGENMDEDAKSTTARPPELRKLPAHLKQYERRPSKVDTNALFADAPVDSDTFMTYLHQNYPPFCNEIANCDELMEDLSASDALLRMEGDNFSRHALTSHYSFQVSVRGSLLALPSPVVRRGQKMFKSEMWDAIKRTRLNEDLVSHWMSGLGKQRMLSEHTEGDLLPKRTQCQLELLPFTALIRHQLDRKLLEIAYFPQAAVSQATALNEKDVPDEDENVDETPTAPAVKVEEEQLEEHIAMEKLYLSDDDIDDF